VIHTQSKTLSGSRARKQEVWVIENPDKSLSKQILNGAGQLAGNITFTKDGSVRIGLDVNGDKVADFYELQVSDGEHSILFSPAGQVAWERFMNGGANPLCTPDASSPGTSFVGGMISGSDKTAMQVVCGRSSGSQGGGGSTGGSSRGGGLSGNPGGRTMGALCKGALSQHRGAPGRSDIVMSDGSFSETVADAITSFIKNGFDREEDGMAAQIGRAILAPLYVPVSVLGASALDDLVSGGPIIGPIRSNHVDTRMPSAEDILHRQHHQQRDTITKPARRQMPPQTTMQILKSVLVIQLFNLVPPPLTIRRQIGWKLPPLTVDQMVAGLQTPAPTSKQTPIRRSTTCARLVPAHRPCGMPTPKTLHTSISCVKTRPVSRVRSDTPVPQRLEVLMVPRLP